MRGRTSGIEVVKGGVKVHLFIPKSDSEILNEPRGCLEEILGHAKIAVKNRILPNMQDTIKGVIQGGIKQIVKEVKKI